MPNKNMLNTIAIIILILTTLTFTITGWMFLGSHLLNRLTLQRNLNIQEEKENIGNTFYVIDSDDSVFETSNIDRIFVYHGDTKIYRGRLSYSNVYLHREEAELIVIDNQVDKIKKLKKKIV